MVFYDGFMKCFQVISEHGFLVGLFNEDELKSDNIKDKEAKIAFLQKIIDATSKNLKIYYKQRLKSEDFQQV